MAIGDVSFVIRDNALGMPSVADNQVALLVGVSSAGEFNVLKEYTSQDDFKTVYGTGPLVNCGCNYLDHPGVSKIRVIRANQLRCDTVVDSDVTRTGALATTDSLPLGFYDVHVIITTAGFVPADGVTTAIFKYSLDGGDTYVTGISIPADGVYEIPDSGVVLNFSNGADGVEATGGFSASEDFSFLVITDATLTAVEKTAAGSTDGSLATTDSAPLDAYNVIVKIFQAGMFADATFAYSLDGINASPEIAMPSNGIYAIPDTGLILNFDEGTTGFDVGDLFTFQTTAPGYSLASLQTAAQAWLDSPFETAFVHFIGESDATIAAAVDVIMADAETAHKYAFALLETRDQTETSVAAYQTALKSTNEWGAITNSPRIQVVPGYVLMYLAATRLVERRSAAWAIGARQAGRPLSEDPGKYATGPLRNVRKTYMDARVDKLLNDQGFTLLRTYDLENAVYCRAGEMKVPLSSDYRFLKERRVMDFACSNTYRKVKTFINMNIPLNPANGFIKEMAARTIDQSLTKELEKNMVSSTPQHAGQVSVSTKRNNNLITDPTLYETIRILPLGTVREISIDIGFINPANQ